MGWANCGQDSRGREIGYAHEAQCDHPGCNASIHRGLAYACGGMHGELEWACEGYFCEAHRSNSLPIDGRIQAVCDDCYAEARAWAVKHPEDSEELINHIRDWEGTDWLDTHQ